MGLQRGGKLLWPSITQDPLGQENEPLRILPLPTPLPVQLEVLGEGASGSVRTALAGSGAQ